MDVPSEAALTRLTITELKGMAKDQGLNIKEKILKKDLVGIVRSNSVKLAEESTPAATPAMTPAKSAKKKARTPASKTPASKTKAAAPPPQEPAPAAVVPATEEEASNEQSARKYTDMMTDAFGYISPTTVTSQFQRHYRAVTWVIAIEALAMVVFPLPQTSDELRTYDPYADKLNLPDFHQAVLHWLVFLIILPVVAAAVVADRRSGSAYATLVFAVARYLVIYLELPVTATVFNFLPVKLFTAVCGVLSVGAFWTHVEFDDIVPDMDEIDWIMDEERDAEED